MIPLAPLGRAAAAAGVALLLAGCAARGGLPPRPAPEALAPGSPLRSASLEEADAWLRHLLMRGEHDAALELLGSRAAPRDRLVRELQRGAVLRAAGRYAESNAALDRAEREVEARYTRSLRRAAGSVLLNDRALEYVPSPSERAMIPFYRMLNHAALGSPAAALVEARKAGALSAEREGRDGCTGEGFLAYVSGLMYQAAGERNDALVSFRRSQRDFDACGEEGVPPPAALGADLYAAARALGVSEVADSAAARYGLSPVPAGEAGELVLVVEQGWVAHRVERDLHVPLFPEEVEGVEAGNTGALAEAAGRVSARLLESEVRRAAWGMHDDDLAAARWAEGAHLLKLSWPVHRLEASRPAGVRVAVGDTAVAAPLVEDVSSDVVREFEEGRGWIVTRTVARALSRYLLAREAEEKVGGEEWGWIVRRLLNLVGNALERADTRSWTLLPDRISVARLSLPPGEHAVRVELLSSGGGVEVLDLGMVAVRPGERVFRSVRVWGTEQGDDPRFALEP